MRTTFTALKIGSGDAFLLKDDGRTILFDSGGDQNRLKKLLKDKGIKKIDLAICSHNDGDHANGFIGLLNSEKKIIDEIWLPYWWSSILLYADEHKINWDQVERISSEINDKSIKDYNPESLFSEEHEPLSDEAFDRVLSRLAEHMNYKDNASTPYSAFYGFAHDMALNMINRLAHDTKYIYFELDSDEGHQLVRDIARDVARDVGYHVADNIAHHFVHHFAHYDSKDTHFADIQYYLFAHMDDFLPSTSFNNHVTQNNVNNIRIMFNNIMEIAVLAYKHDCIIKWFEPTKICITNPPVLHNFKALNSNLKRQVNKLRNTLALAFALHLTVENEYSLVFEYLKNDIPIIRFSADSDCECGNSPYNNSIIITAPHHGSEANANVYTAFENENVIWVRSDCESHSRPCKEFKSMNTKYCLACYNGPQKCEICFKYNKKAKQWKYQQGNKCMCKP